MKTAYYGLDFGTSNCVISVNINGSVKTLPINFSNDKTDILESAIYFSKTNNISYGSEAIKKYLDELEMSNMAKTETVVGKNIVKILQGSEFIKIKESIETTNFNSGRIIRSFKSGLSSSGVYKTNINGKLYDLEDIVTLFLSEIKRRADKILGLNIETVVIGRPYKFVGDNSNATVPLKRLESIAKRSGFKDIFFEY